MNESGRDLIPIRELTLAYVAEEDRIKALVNGTVGPRLDFWLTRRVVVMWLTRAGRFAATPKSPPSPTGSLGKETASSLHTAKQASPQITHNPILRESLARPGEIVERVDIRQVAGGIRLILSGNANIVSGQLTDGEYQAFLDVLSLRTHEAGWFASMGPGPNIERLEQIVRLQ